MKICKFIIVSFLLTGCADKVVETQYITQEVPVPVFKKLPKVICDLKGKTHDDILNRYIECVATQKKVLKLAE